MIQCQWIKLIIKKKVVTKAPIETAKPSPSATVPVITTRAPVDIERSPFQYVTATLSSSISDPSFAC